MPVNTGETLYNLADHKFGMFLTQVTPGTVFFLLFVVLIIALIGTPLTSYVKGKYPEIFGESDKKMKELILDQDVDPYFEVIKKKDRKKWVMEETLCETELEIPRMKKATFLELCETKEAHLNKSRPRLQGVHNYDILSNPFYAEKYCYTPACFPMRSKHVISPYPVEEKLKRNQNANLVRLVVDFPYMRY